MPLFGDPRAEQPVPGRPLTFWEALERLGAMPGVVTGLEGAIRLLARPERVPLPRLWELLRARAPGLAQWAEHTPVPIQVHTEPLEKSAGQTLVRQNPWRVEIQLNPQVTPDLALSTLVHELAHAWAETPRVSRTGMERPRDLAVLAAGALRRWPEHPAAQKAVARLLTEYAPREAAHELWARWLTDRIMRRPTLSGTWWTGALAEPPPGATPIWREVWRREHGPQ